MRHPLWMGCRLYGQVGTVKLSPHRILSPVGGISKYLSNKQKSRRYGPCILAGVGLSELELIWRGLTSGTTT